MQNKKKIIIAASVIICVAVPISVTVGIGIYINSEEDYFKGIEVSFELGDLTDSIEILNPKGFNIFYNDSDSIILNYRTKENVNVTDYVLDGLPPQQIPDTKVIPKPGLGNHSLKLLGINGTGGFCNSTLVYFYISIESSGILGAAPLVHDVTANGEVSTVLFAGIEKGLKANLPRCSQIFLEGPQRNPLDRIYSTIPYTKNISLKFESLVLFIPIMICRSEPWYNHTIHFAGPFSLGSMSGSVSWGASIKNGDVKVFYLSFNFVHIYGSVLYWNDEIRKYDVITVEKIFFDDIHTETYKSNESVLEMPFTQNIMYETDLDGKPKEYQDNLKPQDTLILGMSKEREWFENQGFVGEVFLGNYDYDEVCPVPVRFSIPKQCKAADGLLPFSIDHKFTRTHEDPEDYNHNYRGYENIFSYNLYSI